MKKKWWKEAVVYQIYPRSFKDTDGDGIGDIPGIIKKLDYIKNLGVDVIWLCPVYKSPNKDYGYDVSDYYDIMTEFGSMDDFDWMLEEIKKRELKLILDMVLNHTSDKHTWFDESRKSNNSSNRNYYIWRRGENGKPPNNWQSYFGGDAWTYNPETDDYYLHLFTKNQPDLNWENKHVRREIEKIIRFWLDKGVDGFRMDVISLISKRSFDDTPYKEFNKTLNNVYANGPRVHEFLKEINENVLSHYNIMTVGEGPGINLENAIKYVDKDRKELNMVFHFDIMNLDQGPGGKFDYREKDFIQFKKLFRLWDEKLKDIGWNSLFLGNHDLPRLVSRFGNDGEYWEKSAKALAMLLMTMRGTPYLYQGDEIGMTNVAFPSISDYRDVETLNAYHEMVKKSSNANIKVIQVQSRDNARTPMQWTSEINAGFSFGQPWIQLNPNYHEVNVANQDSNPNSILNFYRRIISYRKRNHTLIYGDFATIQEKHPQVFAYWRWDEKQHYLVIINFGNEEVLFEVDNKFDATKASLVISNYNTLTVFERQLVKLSPWQANLYLLT